MSILIQGIDMPIDYGRCMVIFPDGRVTTEFGSTVIGKAVPVPPHGRTIEKNAVFELIRSFPNVDRQLPAEFMKALYELPTIIPESEVQKGEGKDVG